MDNIFDFRSHLVDAVFVLCSECRHPRKDQYCPRVGDSFVLGCVIVDPDLNQDIIRLYLDGKSSKTKQP